VSGSGLAVRDEARLELVGHFTWPATRMWTSESGPRVVAIRYVGEIAGDLLSATGLGADQRVHVLRVVRARCAATYQARESWWRRMMPRPGRTLHWLKVLRPESRAVVGRGSGERSSSRGETGVSDPDMT
jgi:hypothetical protein